MPSKEEPAYKVIPVGPVKEQIRNLHRRAFALGKHQEFVAALNLVIGFLEARPLDWGDPLHRTHHPGGTVFRGIQRPLVVKYAVLKGENVVFLLNVQPAPSTFLEP